MTSLPDAAREMQGPPGSRASWTSTAPSSDRHHGGPRGEIVGEIEDEHDDGEPDHIIRPPRTAGSSPPTCTSTRSTRNSTSSCRRRRRPSADSSSERFGGLPEVGDRIEIDLPDDPDDLVALEVPPRRFVVAEILALENYVPSRLRLSLHEEERDEDDDDDGPDRPGRGGRE